MARVSRHIGYLKPNWVLLMKDIQRRRMKSALIASIAAAMIIPLAVGAASNTPKSLAARGPDFIPVNIKINHNCTFTATFKNAGSGPQKPNEKTMDHYFKLSGDVFVSGVHYANKETYRTDLVIPIMNPGAVFNFVPSHIVINGPTKVTWTVNKHASGGAGVAELTKANNTKAFKLNCINKIKGNGFNKRPTVRNKVSLIQ
ncbi:MAG: hypothetical protein DHS20C01_29660 [marine bacterium B5-7]|nr:MAG: hypothetical protein DHS20C01_29660 [marine bacterium B5-7]